MDRQMDSIHPDSTYHIGHNVLLLPLLWGTGIRMLTRGLAALPRGNQEPLMVETQMEDSR